MKKGYEKSNEKAYEQIMRLVCGNYRMEEANLEDFIARAIPQLSAKMRKQLNKFFGIDGGINHYEKIQKIIAKKKLIPDAEIQMYQEATTILKKLGSIEILILFRKDVKELMNKIAKKTSGDINSIEKAKWAILYATIICGGPYFFCDRIGFMSMTELENEKKYTLCMINLMRDEYENIFQKMPDGEILIPVVKAWVEDLDIKDQISVLRYFGIRIPKYLMEFYDDAEEIKSIFDLRKLKERIFANGPWATDGHLFTKTGILNDNIKEGFYEAYELMRQGAKITRADPEDYIFGTGIKPVSFYKIYGENGLHEFPYIEEIMLAFRWWNEATAS